MHQDQLGDLVRNMDSEPGSMFACSAPFSSSPEGTLCAPLQIPPARHTCDLAGDPTHLVSRGEHVTQAGLITVTMISPGPELKLGWSGSPRILAQELCFSEAMGW